MSTRAWALLGAAVFAAALLRSLADGIGLVDESWFLQVVARVRAGDVLYRDVFFGATPLSVYLTSLVTMVTGVDVIAVKIVTNAAFAATVGLTIAIARRAAIPETGTATVAAVILIAARPYTSAPYTPVATALFMATLLLVVRRHTIDPGDTNPRRSLDPWIGIAAGLTFLAKQNVGLLALGAALAAMLVHERERARAATRHVLQVALVAALTVGAGLVPVVISGGVPMLADYGFLNKGAYVSIGATPMTDSLRGWLTVAAHPTSFAALAETLHGLVLFLPPVAVIAATMAAWRSRDGAILTLLVFAIAAALIAYPRWNRFHLAYAVPALLIALAAAIARRARPSAPARGASAAVLIAAVLFVASRSAIVMAAGARLSTIPHFQGALVMPALDDSLTRSARALAAAAAGPLMVVSPRAGFLYLASGVPNPTPFDFPAATSVGRHGTADIIAMLTGGRVPQACIGHDRGGLYEFTPVVALIREQFDRGEDIGLCTLYRQRTSTPPPR